MEANQKGRLVNLHIGGSGLELGSSGGTSKLTTHAYRLSLSSERDPSSWEEEETDRTVYVQEIKQTVERSYLYSSHLQVYHIGVLYFPSEQVSSFRRLDYREEPVHVKERKGHKLQSKKRKISGQVRTSSRIRQGEQINYAKIDLVESDTDSEFTLCGSESGFGSVKEEPDTGLEQREASWTPLTLRNRATQVWQQFARITEETVQLQMARESKKASMDKLMETMVTTGMEDQKREREREIETQRREREREDQREREKREQIEREEQREERRIEREERRKREEREQQAPVDYHA